MTQPVDVTRPHGHCLTDAAAGSERELDQCNVARVDLRDGRDETLHLGWL